MYKKKRILSFNAILVETTNKEIEGNEIVPKK